MRLSENTLLSIFFPGYKIKSGEKIYIDKEKKQITLPEHINLEDKAFLGLLFFLESKEEKKINMDNDLNKLCLTQHQIVEFCVKNQKYLREDDWAIFFLFKVVPSFLNAFASL